jgi:hypothetical protein
MDISQGVLNATDFGDADCWWLVSGSGKEELIETISASMTSVRVL